MGRGLCKKEVEARANPTGCAIDGQGLKTVAQACRQSPFHLRRSKLNAASEHHEFNVANRDEVGHSAYTQIPFPSLKMENAGGLLCDITVEVACRCAEKPASAVDFVEEVARGSERRIAAERHPWEATNFCRGERFPEEKQIGGRAPDQASFRSLQKRASIRIHSQAVNDDRVGIERTGPMERVDLMAAGCVDAFGEMDEERHAVGRRVLLLRKFGVQGKGVGPAVLFEHANGKVAGE